MTTPIRHITCGQIVMWYVGRHDENTRRSRDVFYLDGSQPKPDYAPIKCSCGQPVKPNELRRCFDEDLDPGPEVKAAIAQRQKLLSDPITSAPVPGRCNLQTSGAKSIRSWPFGSYQKSSGKWAGLEPLQ